jgi:hypothetical protein
VYEEEDGRGQEIAMQIQQVHTLVVTEGPMVGERYTLFGRVSTLGRSSNNTIVLESTQISRYHAQIHLLPEGALIQDIGSTNGTFVNGRRLTEPVMLAHGDLIRFAEFATLQYRVHVLADTEPATAAGPQGFARVTDEDVRVAPATPYARPADTATPAVPPAAYAPSAPSRARADAVQGRTEVLAPRPTTAADAHRGSSCLYVVILILLVLICLCAALAVYLWFAPLTFWERAFDLLGIPLPSGALLTVTRSVPGLACALPLTLLA